jgi:hypothetical protein
VARRYSRREIAAEDKEARPEETAIAHHHGGKNGKGASRAFRIEAEIPWNPNRYRHSTVLRMEALPQVESVPAALRATATGAADQTTCFSYSARRYFHNGGRLVPFLLLRKRW